MPTRDRLTGGATIGGYLAFHQGNLLASDIQALNIPSLTNLSQIKDLGNAGYLLIDTNGNLSTTGSQSALSGINSIASVNNTNLVLSATGTGIIDIDDTVDIDGILYADNISIDGNTIASENTNGDVIITPNGNGNISASKTILFPSLSLGTFDPPGGGSGADTATNVAIAIPSGAAITGWNDGYIRNLLKWTASGNIEIGQGYTTMISGITMQPGASGGVAITSGATTGSAMSLTANSLTSGKGLLIQSSAGSAMTGSLLEVLGNNGITTGDLAKFSSTGYVGSTTSGMIDIISSSTARATNSSLLFINSTGNVNSAITKGAYISAANAGSGATSIALELNATGTNATALNVVAGGTNLQSLSGTSAGFSSGVTANTLTSTVATGTAPLVVASTTKVTNLNADLFDGIDSTNFIYGQNGSGSNSAPTTWAQTHVTQYKSGFWDISGASWTPDTGWWWGTTLAHVSNTASYLFGAQMIFSNSLNPDFKYRGMSGGASGAAGNWKTVINAEDTQTISGIKTFTAPRIASGSHIADSNGNELINFPSAVANAVNELYVSNATTGNAVSISTTGSDTNIGLTIGTKGSGAIALNSNTNITGNAIVSGNTTSSSFKTANWTIEQHGTTGALVFNFA